MQPYSLPPQPVASSYAYVSFYGESLGGHGFVMVLPTITLQAPLDRARGELPSDTQTLTSHWEKFCGKTDEIWRSVITTQVDRPRLDPIPHSIQNASLIPS